MRLRCAQQVWREDVGDCGQRRQRRGSARPAAAPDCDRSRVGSAHSCRRGPQTELARHAAEVDEPPAHQQQPLRHGGQAISRSRHGRSGLRQPVRGSDLAGIEAEARQRLHQLAAPRRRGGTAACRRAGRARRPARTSRPGRRRGARGRRRACSSTSWMTWCSSASRSRTGSSRGSAERRWGKTLVLQRVVAGDDAGSTTRSRRRASSRSGAWSSSLIVERAAATVSPPGAHLVDEVAAAGRARRAGGRGPRQVVPDRAAACGVAAPWLRLWRTRTVGLDPWPLRLRRVPSSAVGVMPSPARGSTVVGAATGADDPAGSAAAGARPARVRRRDLAPRTSASPSGSSEPRMKVLTPYARDVGELGDPLRAGLAASHGRSGRTPGDVSIRRTAPGSGPLPRRPSSMTAFSSVSRSILPR